MPPMQGDAGWPILEVVGGSNAQDAASEVTDARAVNPCPYGGDPYGDVCMVSIYRSPPALPERA